MFAEPVDVFFADFAATAVFNGGTAQVILDRETPDVFTGTRTDRWVMQLQGCDLHLAVGDQGTVDGHAFRVLDVDKRDGVITYATLGALS